MRTPALALVSASVLAACAATGSAVHTAQTSTQTQPPARQASDWTIPASHTNSRAWQYLVPNHQPATPSDGDNVRSAGLLTATVSLRLGGAPVRIRLLDNGKHLAPSFVAFAPSTTNDGFSYTFSDVGKRADCGHTIRLEWKSPTGSTTTLIAGNVEVEYTPAKNDADVCT